MKAGSMVKCSLPGEVPQVLPLPANVSVKKILSPWAMSAAWAVGGPLAHHEGKAI